MDNFFITNQNSLPDEPNEEQNNYKKVFIEAAQSIRKEINKLKPENVCESCSHNKECKIEKKDVFTQYPLNCKYRDWQLQILTYLSGDYRQKLKKDYESMMSLKDNYYCSKCGACCRLATSEHSFQQLQQLAIKGNKFAQDFVSIYLPYETEKDAENANPTFYKLINNTIKSSRIYYYYCKKLENNLCSDYENRPQICKDYPHNPLKLLPESCTYNDWKNSVSHKALLLKAKVDILDYYKRTLQ